ncbi:MAG: MFS transporter [Chlamydiia bacterium]|nr:MFS transporter [Chlamydiia bacterium]
MRTFLKSSVNSLTIRRFSSYTYLNLAQFLGALNDNIYKLLIVYFFIELEGAENSHIILSMSGALFVLPFILFSATSGMLADRFSKRNIIIATKVFEVLIMLAGVFSFYFHLKWGLFAVLFLLATHSAIFAPSKYGILPEIVSHDKIAKANGVMSSFTFLAIIVGTFFASFILDITDRNFLLAGGLCTAFSLIGFLASICIEYTEPAGSEKKFDPLFFKEIFEALKVAKEHPSLLTAVFGSAFFLFLGAFVQLNIIPYALQSLYLSDVQGGYLFLLTALGIGTGSLMAGKISGKTVELGLVPLAGIGVALSCFLLDYFSVHLIAVIPLVLFLGFAGGLYQIPMDSYIQVASPAKGRGQIVAATNFLSFIGVFAASAMVFVVGEVLGLPADKGFTIVGGFALFITAIISWQFFDYACRLACFILSRLHFQMVFFGLKNIPDEPVVYVLKHRAWNDTLILLGAQRRRVAFFIEQEKPHSKLAKRLYGLLRIYYIESTPSAQDTATMRACLDKGMSVAVLIEGEDVVKEIEALKADENLQKEESITFIPVVIDTGEKETQSPLFARFLKKIRVPAAVSFG